MTETTKNVDIDRIVREVLIELGQMPGGEVSAPAAGKSPAAPRDQAPSAQPRDSQFVVSGRVVTLSAVEGRLDGVRQLIVPPGAVVTPAVRDLLLQKNIGIGYSESAAGAPAGAVRLVMLTADKGFDPAPLIAALRNEGISVEASADDCVIVAADRLAGEVLKPGTLGLLLAGRAAAGLCLANRQPGVRAVSRVEDAGGVGANLLVLEPSARGVFQLKQAVVEFCRGGVRPCPEVFRERLG